MYFSKRNVMWKVLAVMWMSAVSLFASGNLFVNGDFSDGWRGFGFSDDYPKNLNARIEKDDVVGNYLTYNSRKNEYGGLNFSEVHLGKKGKYKMTFKAKASKPIAITLFAMSYSKNIYRRMLANFDITTEWKTYTYDVNMENMIKYGSREWVPFRIEKKSKKFPSAETPEAELSFADFMLYQIEGEPTSTNASGISADVRLAVKKSKRAKCSYASWGVVSKKERLTAIADIYNSSDTSQNRKITLKIVEYLTEKVIYEDSVKKELAVGGNKVKFRTPPVKKNGIYNLRLFVDEKEIDTMMFAATPRVRAKRGELPLDIGYCGVLTNGEIGKPTPEEMDFLADTGISFIRTWDSGNPFNWRCIEPQEGKYFWDITDETVRLATKNNIEVLPVLGGMFFIYPPEMGIRGHRQADWLYKKSEVVRPIAGFEKQGRKAIKPPMEDWNRMVSAVATRYKGKIKYYEIMNEPNIIWRDPMTYYPYLESANKIIKSIDANNKIVGFSTTGDYGGNPNGFLAKLLSAGAGKFSDIISFHSYSSLYEDSPKPSDVLIQDFFKSLEKNGVKQPLWHTELYYMNPMSRLGGADHENGPRFHAGYLIRRYLVDVANGISADLLVPAAFTTIRKNDKSGVKTSNFAEGNYMPYASFGETIRNVPSKIFIVSAVFADILKNTSFAKKHYFKEKIMAYEFADREGPRKVATLFALGSYMENVSGHRISLVTKLTDPLMRTPINMGKIPEGIDVFDIFGNKVPVLSDGSWIFDFSPIPYYIVAKDAETLDAFLKILK